MKSSHNTGLGRMGRAALGAAGFSLLVWLVAGALLQRQASAGETAQAADLVRAVAVLHIIGDELAEAPSASVGILSFQPQTAGEPLQTALQYEDAAGKFLMVITPYREEGVAGRAGRQLRFYAFAVEKGERLRIDWINAQELVLSDRTCVRRSAGEVLVVGLEHFDVRLGGNAEEAHLSLNGIERTVRIGSAVR